MSPFHHFTISLYKLSRHIAQYLYEFNILPECLRDFQRPVKPTGHHQNIKPLVNDICPGFFSDLSGNSRSQKTNKAQTKRTKITGVQYFRGFWFFLRMHQQEWCQLFSIIYPLCSLNSLKICINLTFLPPPLPPIECAATKRVRPHCRQSTPSIRFGRACKII